MNVKFLNTELDTDNFLENVLFRQGVYDIEGFLNIDKTALENPENYDNIEEGYQLLKSNLDKKIAILIDPDVDGMTSSSEIYLYIKELNPTADIKLFFHKGKQHGLSDKSIFDEILKSDIDLLIIPDAGSNDFEQHKILKDKGVELLVLDHHETTKYSEDAVVINNQLSDKVQNKQLSGAGVVYKFLQYYDKKEKLKLANNYLDLVAFGNISDMVSILSDETRYLCLEGLKNKHLNNNLFTELIDKYIKDKVTITNISWNVTPKVNSILRAGTQKDKADLFYAFVNPTMQVKFKKNSRTQEAIMDLSTKVTMLSEQIKKRQDDEVKKSLSLVEGLVDNTKKILIIKLDEELDKSYTGLVANKLIGSYGKPVLLLQKSVKSKIYTGSGRCPNLCYDIENFKDYIASSNLFELAEGHSGAFGVEIKEENIKPFIDWAENNLKDKEIKVENTYEVEGEISADDLEEDFISEVGGYDWLWGMGLNEPKFYITGVKINSKDIKMVFNKTILTFDYNYVQYVKNYCSRVFRESLGVDSGMEIEMELNIIGTFVIERYNGKKYPKVNILDFEIVE